MALVIEDGSLVSGANSYVSLADAIQYATDRGYDVDLLTEPLLLKGADYVNAHRKRFKGIKLQPVESNMQWPRRDVIMDEYELEPDVIPECVIFAQIETAFEIANSRDPLETLERLVLKKEVIGPLQFEYETRAGSPGSTDQPFDYQRIRAQLRAVLRDDRGRTSR